MTYELSLKNIELLKNHVMPFDCMYIYIDFKNHSDFKLVFLTKADSGNFEDYIREKFNAKLPFAYVRMPENNHEILYYEDELTRYEFDFTTHEVLMHDYKISSKNRCPAQLKLDMARLLLILKNM